jgi:hypothetical protein
VCLVERREVQGDHGLVQSASATQFVVLGAKAENAPVWFQSSNYVLIYRHESATKSQFQP